MSRSEAEGESESAEVAPRRAEIDPEQLLGAGTREGVWTVGEAEDVAGRLHFTLGRELSDQQVAEYKEALAFVLDRQEQPALKLVIGNYREYRALEASLVISSATSATLSSAATKRLFVSSETGALELADERASLR